MRPKFIAGLVICGVFALVDVAVTAWRIHSGERLEATFDRDTMTSSRGVLRRRMQFWHRPQYVVSMPGGGQQVMKGPSRFLFQSTLESTFRHHHSDKVTVFVRAGSTTAVEEGEVGWTALGWLAVGLLGGGVPLLRRLF